MRPLFQKGSKCTIRDYKAVAVNDPAIVSSDDLPQEIQPFYKA
jgi:hypothetical protein